MAINQFYVHTAPSGVHLSGHVRDHIFEDACRTVPGQWSFGVIEIPKHSFQDGPCYGNVGNSRQRWRQVSEAENCGAIIWWIDSFQGHDIDMENFQIRTSV